MKPRDTIEPNAPPDRSAAYILKLYSAYILNITEYTIPAKKKGTKRRKKKMNGMVMDNTTTETIKNNNEPPININDREITLNVPVSLVLFIL
jgi:hypothetical protein